MGSASLSGTLQETLDVFEVAVPATTPEVADRLDIGRRTAYARLERLAERERLDTKKVGANARVWWLPPGEDRPDGNGAGRTDRERELARYGRLFEESPDVNVVVDPDGRFQFVTPSVTDVFGYEPSELVGEVGFEYIHPDDRERALSEFAEMVARPGYEPTIEFRFEHSDGSWIVLEALGRNLLDDPDVGGIVVYTRDVTERTERKRELERYETIVETVDDGIYVVDEDGRFAAVNDAYTEMVGRAREELLGAPVAEVADETIQQEARRLQRELADGERETATMEAELTRPDGETWVGEATFALMPADEGQERVGVVRDVTDRKERERELEEARRRYRTLLDNFPNGAVGLVEEDLEYVAVGGSPLAEIDASPERMEGQRIADVLPESVAETLVPHYEAALDGESRSFLEESGGRIYRLRFVPVRDDEGAVFAAMGMSQDVTERERREQQLKRRIDQQETITELGQRVLDGEKVEGLVAETVDRLAELLDVDYAKVLELGDDGDVLHLREGVGWQDDRVGSTTVPASDTESQAAWTLTADDPVVVDDFTAESRFSGPALLVEHGVRSGISTIVGPRDDPWGVLGVHDTDPREFSQQDVTFLQSAATVLGAAIRHRDNERQLFQQRKQLVALNNLNQVIQEISEAVIDQSTRDEIERTVCEHLAQSNSYEFAWIGDVDVASKTVDCRAEAGVEGYLDDITITVDPDDERSEGPTGRALRTGEIQTTRDIATDPRHDPWREHVKNYDVRSAAAIPIVYDDAVYGVLNVYATRPNAFEGEERAVISQLGEIIGHAIVATERKRALISDEVVELEFHIANVFDAVGVDRSVSGTIEFDHAVPLDDGEFLVYGSVTPAATADLERLVEAHPQWTSVQFHGRDGSQTDGLADEPEDFELRLREPPVLSVLAARGGSLERAVVEGGDYRMTLHLSPGTDVHRIIDAVQVAYPTAEIVKRRQLVREEDPADGFGDVLMTELTEHQRTALQVAYHAGFFEWPRRVSGEEVAQSLGISSSTFHQHLRKAERKVIGALQ
jgi:PAS domain S-box-containing protein